MSSQEKIEPDPTLMAAAERCVQWCPYCVGKYRYGCACGTIRHELQQLAHRRAPYERGVYKDVNASPSTGNGEDVNAMSEREKAREAVIEAAAELATKLRNMALLPDSVYAIDTKLCAAVDALAALGDA